MPAHKKKPIPKHCIRCGKSFKSTYAPETLCPKCQASLPKCDSCHTIMAKEYGYTEGFARKVGKYRICDSCNVEVIRKGSLRISQTHCLYLLPSGRVKVKAVPAEEKVD